MELGSGSCGYRSEDASREHLIVLLCALVSSVNIHLDVHGELFNRELSIFTEQVVVIGVHLDFSDGSSSGSPSGLVTPLCETCRDIEEFSGGVVKIVERQCCGPISVSLCDYGAAVVDDLFEV